MLRTYKGLCWFVALAILTGCWDRVEIEDRGFVVGTAIDAAADPDTFLLTFQFVVPNAMQGKSPAEGKGGGNSYQNISAEGRTLFKAARKMSNETSRSPYLEHNKIIIVSERLARAGKLEEVLDLFIRDPEMRRAAKVMISVGEAKKLLSIKPAIEKLPVQYINSTSENPDKSDSITPPTNIGDVHRFLLEEHSYAIPKISSIDHKVSVSGAAVFGRDNRLRGFLNEEQTSGRNFFRGTIRAGALEVLIDDDLVVFEVKRSGRRISADVSDGERPVFNLDVSVEGNVGESYSKVDLLDSRIISSIEDKVGKKVESIMEDVLSKSQTEYRADILGLGEYLYENHYRTWEAIRDNWDQGQHIFSRSRVNIDVNVKLRIIGAIDNNQP